MVQIYRSKLWYISLIHIYGSKLWYIFGAETHIKAADFKANVVLAGGSARGRQSFPAAAL